MSTHAASTVAVRFLGLILIAVSLPTVVSISHEVLQEFLIGNGWSYLSPFVVYDRAQEPLGYLGWFILAAAGAYMFLSGRWVVARLTRGLGRACPHCGYDLRGTPGAVCPECGRSTAGIAGANANK